jgi:hypothetical protein
MKFFKMGSLFLLIAISCQSLYPATRGNPSAAGYRTNAQTTHQLTTALYGQGTGGHPTAIPVPVSEGGTGASILTQYGVLIGQGTSPVTAVTGSTGTVLIGNTSANPSFSATPTVTSITILNAPVVGTDGANKDYVDLFAAGLTVKAACVAATTVALTVIYDNGAAGVGATLTNAGAQATFSIDGQSPTVGQRVLIKNQTDTTQNGIYIVSNVGSGVTDWVLTRATDFDTPAEIQPGNLVPVINGTVNSNTFWMQTATVTTIGTDPITFTLFTQPGIQNLAGDTGTATGTTVTLAGGNNIVTSAAVGTVTIDLNGTTNHAVQVGNASGSLTSLGVGTNGQVLLGSTAADPSFVTPTAGTGLSVTTNATTLAYALQTPVTVANGGTGQVSFTANQLITGGTTATGALQQVTAGASGQALIATGSSLPVFGTLGVSGGGTGAVTLTNHGVLVGQGTSAIVATTAGSSGQALISGGASADPAFGTLGVSGGGTGAVTLTAHGVLIGEGTSAVTATTAGSSGQALISGGASADPAFGTLGVSGGGTGAVTFANTNQPVLVGTTATGAFQSVTAGSSGQALISGGASTPAFGTLGVSGGGTGAVTLTNHGVLVGQGTSAIVATTAGSSGQALISGGASADPAFGTLGVSGGGTGAVTLTAHGVLIGEGTSAVTATTAGSSGQALISGGASADPAFGTLGVSGGGTGLTSMTAAGRLLYSTGATALTTLAVGTAGQGLTVNSGATAPQWSNVFPGYVAGTNFAFGGVASTTLPSLGASPDNTMILSTSSPGSIAAGATDCTALGYNALNAISTGVSNTAVGSRALAAMQSNNHCTAVGAQALVATTASQNTAVGSFAMGGNTTGQENTGVGYSVLSSNLSGQRNVGVGAFALVSNTASNNTAVGYNALGLNGAAVGNVAVGYRALVSSTANHSTAIGYETLADNPGDDCTALGYNALKVCTSSDNTALGSGALALNTTGSNNTAVGRSTLGFNIIGESNVGMGSGSLGLCTGSNNTALGAAAGATATTGSNNIYIGFLALPISSGESNNTVIGNSTTQTAYLFGVNGVSPTGGSVVVNNSSAQLGTVTNNATSGIPLISQGTSTTPVFGTAVVAGGGTGAVTLTNHGVLIGQATSPIVATTAGSSGQALISGGASADPAFGTLGVSGGGTGAVTLTAHGVLIGEGTSAVTATTAGSSGQALISGGASADPAFGTLGVSGGGTGRASFTNTNQPLLAGTTSTGGFQSVTAGSSGQALISAGASTPAFGTLGVSGGGTGAVTLTNHGVLLGQGTSAVVATTAGSSGQALVSGGASADPAFGTLGVSGGGTGAVTLTAHGVLIGEGTSAVTATTAGSSGQALISGGASADPAFGTLGVSGGGTGAVTLTAHGVLIGEGTSAVTATTAGSSGQALISGGASADPAFGTLGVSGGGTGVASLTAYQLVTGGTTTTNPVQQVTAGTSLGQGATNVQILSTTSSSALPTWTDLSTAITLTNAQIKALNATPITVINAPGSNKVLYVTSCMAKLNYGGTSAFTAAASQTITLQYSGGTNIISAVCSNAFITSTASQIMGTINGGQDQIAYSTITNSSITVKNPVATEITGNAANDNTITLLINYQILSI